MRINKVLPIFCCTLFAVVFVVGCKSVQKLPYVQSTNITRAIPTTTLTIPTKEPSVSISPSPTIPTTLETSNNLAGEYIIYSVFQGDSMLISIRMATLDGKEVAVVAEQVGSLVSVALDGSELAYMSEGSGKVSILDRENGHVLEISTPNRSCNGLALSPNKQMIALSCGDIFIKKRLGGEWDRITNWGESDQKSENQYDFPAWSPDGTWLAYGSPAGPFSINPLGGLYFTDLSCLNNIVTCKEKTITHSATDWAFENPVWSQNSRYLAFKFGAVGAINIWDPNDRGGKILTLPSAFDNSLISGIAWAPDNENIAFSYMTDIYTVPIRGGDPALVGKDLGYLNAWVKIAEK